MHEVFELGLPFEFVLDGADRGGCSQAGYSTVEVSNVVLKGVVGIVHEDLLIFDGAHGHVLRWPRRWHSRNRSLSDTQKRLGTTRKSWYPLLLRHRVPILIGQTTIAG